MLKIIYVIGLMPLFVSIITNVYSISTTFAILHPEKDILSRFRHTACFEIHNGSLLKIDGQPFHFDKECQNAIYLKISCAKVKFKQHGISYYNIVYIQTTFRIAVVFKLSTQLKEDLKDEYDCIQSS